MSHSPDAGVVLNLARILVGKQVDSDVVMRGMELICTVFSFDCALVYEIDQENIFHQKEVFFTSGLLDNAGGQDAFCGLSSFSVDDLAPECRAFLALAPAMYMDRQSSPRAIPLLNMFGAFGVLAGVLVDQSDRINGFALFLNAKEREIPVDQETLLLSVQMLNNYISRRIYANKVKFAQSFMNILDNTGIDIYVNDFYTHEILYANKSMAAPYGGIGQFLGKPCWQVLFPEQGGPCSFCPQKKLIDENGTPSKVYSWDYQRPFDGSWFRVFSSTFRWIDGRLAHVVSSADITDNKKNEELIAYMANYDALTGLPNRRMLIKECHRKISQAADDEKGYVLFFDIDGFKAINDTLGHDAGDEFLVQLGAFFSGIPLLKEAIFRNGGDEFVGLLSGHLESSVIIYLANFIQERFKKPWALAKGDVSCGVSMGVACYPEDGTTAEALISKADQAMYAVKKAGGGALGFVTAR